MKKLYWGAAVLLSVFLVTGCSNMFEANVFAAFEDTSVNYDDLKYDDISSKAQSQAFYDDIASDTTGEKKDSIVKALDGVLDDPDAPAADKQQAALIKADVFIKTDPAAEDAINNVSSLITSMASGTTGDSTSEDVIKTLLPASVVPNADAGIDAETAKANFVSMVADLSSAAEAMTQFNDALVVNADGTVTAPDGADMGTIAQKAVICAAVDLATTLVTDTAGNPVPEEESAAALFDVLFGGADAASPTYTLSSDSEALITDATDSVSNILAASGLDPATMFPGLVPADTTGGTTI